MTPDQRSSLDNALAVIQSQFGKSEKRERSKEMQMLVDEFQERFLRIQANVAEERLGGNLSVTSRQDISSRNQEIQRAETWERKGYDIVKREEW